ncbi:carboxylesterase [Phyllosticta capitalensis]
MLFSSQTGRNIGLALGIGSAFVAPTQAQLYDKVIQTTYGPDRTVAAFLGIPFAADTAYQNRWKAPQPRESWNKTLIADSFGPPCPSSSNSGYSEDCLSLNIWTSAKSATDKLPVIVWNQGSDETSDNAWWYGGGMAQQHDVILVSFNRRDDAFGYLAHPDLNAESLAANGHNSSGNYGILDHLECLKWVQKNIANFGGDPDRVTIMGQSFGSSQVYHAVNSALFSGLFVGGISESGIHTPYNPWVAGLATSYVNMSRALVHGVNYTTNHNASSIAELRTLPVEDLLVGSQDRVDGADISWTAALNAGYPLIFKPVLDGYVLPAKYIELAVRGPANNVPLITGGTKDENGANPSDTYSVAEVNEWQKAKFGDMAQELFKLYPTGNTTVLANKAWNAQTRDEGLVSQWLYAKDWVKSNTTAPIYTYYWQVSTDHAPPGQSAGAFHQSEIMYALNALYANVDAYPFTTDDYSIQSRISAYWANFAKTQNPNHGGSYSPYPSVIDGVAANTTLPYWAPQDGKTRQVFRIGDAWENRTLAVSDEAVDFHVAYFAKQTPF